MRAVFLAWVLGLMVLMAGCHSKANREIPQEIQGIWTTNAPSYHNCFFELDDRLVTFVSGELLDNIDVNFVLKVEADPGKGAKVPYTIYYEDAEGQESKFSFLYEPANGGTIRLKNKMQVEWRRQTDAES